MPHSLEYKTEAAYLDVHISATWHLAPLARNLLKARLLRKRQ